MATRFSQQAPVQQPPVVGHGHGVQKAPLQAPVQIDLVNPLVGVSG